MKPYSDKPTLAHIYLEDSWVLGIETNKTDVVFECEFVLLESHENYRPALKGEQYCYRRGKLRFDNCKMIKWHSIKDSRSTDLDGSIDMGNIYSFKFDDDFNKLEGDWGEVDITSNNISIVFERDDAI